MGMQTPFPPSNRSLSGKKIPDCWQKRFTKQSVILKSRHGTATFFADLLLLCGDISLNPGPSVKHRCAVCDKPVKSNQKAIQCDYCDRWHHAMIGSLVYDALANTSCMWICCDCGLPSFSRSLFDSSSEVLTSIFFSPLDENSYDPSFNDSFANSTTAASNGPEQALTSTPRKTRERRFPRVKILTINCRSLRSEYKRCEFVSVIASH